MSAQPDLTPGPDGNSSCGYVEGDGPGTTPCGQPGTWHIAWRLAVEHHGVQAAFVCDTHMRAVNDQFVYADRDDVGPDCGMPGTVWMDSRKVDVGRCRVGAPTT